MEKTIDQNETLDARKSLQIINATIETSKKLLTDDGLLLICWGFVFSFGNLWRYYKQAVLTAWWLRNIFDALQILLGIAVIALTAYFIFFRKKKAITYTAISTRFVWIGVIVAHNMMVLITKYILTDINFALIQPLQLVLIGFAFFVSGGIYRYYLLSVSGVIMWIAAVSAARFSLNDQFLIRGIAEVICFIIPGILMYTPQKKQTAHV
ncbi:hypothetical protein GM418_26510 [Maribellus comscasis]|uniref:Uncharacterized protein n=1 Tax=Maribellus comscasis TaxID=2681766 RepID=A0A6I6JVB3_9BACT|nr:hypothetical protein [Maribellus comscasis]QGY47085.1 hypothetical protein GM418_26510 [Maribellus comscasis]